MTIGTDSRSVAHAAYMTETKSPGESAYEAYCNVLRLIPIDLDAVDGQAREAWDAAVQAGTDAVIANAIPGASEPDMNPTALALKILREREDLRAQFAAVTAELEQARAANERTGQRWLDSEAEATTLRAHCERLRTENTQFRETNEQMRTGMELLNARLSLLDEALAQVAKHADDPDSSKLRNVAKIARRARITAEPEPQS